MTDQLDLAYTLRFASILASERGLAEDAAQEGVIAAWSASQQRPGRPGTYYRAAAKNGVHNFARARTQFGSTSRQGRRDAHDTASPLQIENERGEQVYVVEPVHEDNLESVELGHVRAAVAELPLEDRRLVFGRYWEDKGFAELAEDLGRPAGTLSRRWTQIIRPVLREKLAA